MIVNAPALPPPTEAEIEITMSKIYDKLDLPEMDLLKNAAVKEGYEAAVDILADDVRTYAGIPAGLKTIQGRAICVLAIDYLSGDVTEEVLVGVPVKK